MKAPPERDVDGKTVIVLPMKPSRAGPLIMVTQDFADRSEPALGRGVLISARLRPDFKAVETFRH